MRIFGVDIGGTSIKYALFDGENIVESGQTSSNAKEGAQKLLENLFTLCDSRNFDALGVSTAGMVGRNGEIAYANENIPNYTGVKLREILSMRYGVPVTVLNDIYAGAYSQKYRDDEFYFVALGTGVSGAYVGKDGLLWGNDCFAGQIGYLKDRLGKSEIDKSASTRGLEQIAGISAIEVFEKADEGDESAVKSLEEWGKEIVHLLTMIVGFFNPPRIVIGGSVSAQGEKLLSIIKSQFSLLPEPYKGKFVLETAIGGGLSGVIGAVNYLKEKINER